MVAHGDLCFLAKRQEVSCASDAPWVVVTYFHVVLWKFKMLE